jgi:hypothetical protein
MGGEGVLAASSHYPHLRTSTRRGSDMPPGITYMPKPWQPLKVLIAAEEAIAGSVELQPN